METEDRVVQRTEQEDRVALGTLLRLHRERRGLTREEVAERVATGLSVETLSKVERGRVRPRRHTLLQVIAALGLDEAERRAVLTAWRAIPASPSWLPAAAVPARRGRRAGARVPSPHVQTPPTRLLGRESDLATIVSLLRGDGARLLTLTGPAGVGKTRLAVEVGAHMAADFPDGCVFVDLSPVRDPALVPAALAQGLGLQDVGSAHLLPRLYTYLRERQALLILDNFEQVLRAASWLADLLTTCPGMRLLVTSREALHLRWEQTYRVVPLALPDPQHLPPLPELAQVPAVALFLQRAQALTPAFTLTADNARAVAELCVHLDGLPLALELAAARTSVLAPRMVLERLEQRLVLLRWEAQDLPERQHTLRAAIDWSYDLLDPGEQALFRHLGVFVGRFSLDAAEAVIGAAGGAGGTSVPAERRYGAYGEGEGVLEGLASLVDKSLVQIEDWSTDAVCYRLLESMREYALEQLERAGEAAAARDAHARYFLALAERAEPELVGPDQRSWVRCLEQVHDNLHAALGWLATQGEDERALRLAAALGYFWWTRGYVAAGRRALEETLARAPHASPRVRAKALTALGILLLWQGEEERARAVVQDGLTLARTLDDTVLLALSLTYLGIVAQFGGDTEASTRFLDEALDRARQGEATWATAHALTELGVTALGAHRYDRAERLLTEARARYRALGDERTMVEALAWLSIAVHARGDVAQAAALIRHGLEVSCGLDDRRLVHLCADAVVWLAGDRAPPVQVARLLGAAEALRQVTGFEPRVWQRSPFAPVVAAHRARLSQEEVAAAWAEGASLSLQQMVELAVQVLAAVLPAPTRPTQPGGRTRHRGVLSAREQEVLRLVAEGRSNQEIAARLYITERTVRYHLSSVFNKLGADNRTQAVTLAHAQSLL